MNRRQRAPRITPAEPIVQYIALQPYFLIKRTMNDAIPAPKKYPEFSIELAVDRYSGGKLLAIN